MTSQVEGSTKITFTICGICGKETEKSWYRTRIGITKKGREEYWQSYHTKCISENLQGDYFE